MFKCRSVYAILDRQMFDYMFASGPSSSIVTGMLIWVKPSSPWIHKAKQPMSKVQSDRIDELYSREYRLYGL